jgi:hypothetical protein
MPRHHGSTCGDGHAIEEVTAGDAAFHSQIAVAYVAQRASESPKCSDWNIQLKCSNWNILYVQRESKINCKKRRISGLPTAGVSITHFLKSVNQAFPQTSTACGGWCLLTKTPSEYSPLELGLERIRDTSSPADAKSVRRDQVPSPSGTLFCSPMPYPALTCGANEYRRFATQSGLSGAELR